MIKSKEGRLSLVIKGVSTAYANALRRSVNEIPILAVDEVEITKNDSVLFDEVLAHRIGLLPLDYDKTFTLREACSCKGKGCSKCSAELVLSVSGGTERKLVKAAELKSKTVRPVYGDMPLVFLEKGQEIELVAKAKLGKGKEHAKYSAGLVFFKASPIIEIEKSCDSCKKCVDICPKDVFSAEPKVAVKNLLNCDLCNACVEECQKQGKSAIKVSASEEDFIFEVESWGCLKPKEILIEACEVMGGNIGKFVKEVNKIK